MLLDILTEKFKNYKFYAIGGYVRNKIYGGDKSKDIDILTNATEEEISNLLGRDFYHIKINDVIRIKDIQRDSHIDMYSYSDLEINLNNRDFKVNKVLYDLHDKVYIVNNDFNRFSIEYIRDDYYKEVPLSIFRAIRISLQCNILLSKQIENIIDLVDVKSINKNNLRKEIFDIIMEDNGIETLKKYGLLEKIIPQFKETYNFNQNSVWHDLNLYNHTASSLEESPKVLEIRLAMLFHDLGKLYTFTTKPDGHFSYKGHENLSCNMAEQWLLEYETPHNIINTVLNLIKYHMNRDIGIEKGISKIGKKTMELLMDVNKADILGRLNVNDEEIFIVDKRIRELKQIKQVIGKPIDKNKPTLAIMVGLPRSGKTSYVKKYLSDYDYISRDEIRERVFGYKGNMNHEEEVSKLFTEMYQNSLNNNKNIVIDNTNVQSKYRNRFINSAKSRKYNTIAIYIDTDYEDVINNANKEGFPISVVESMQCRLNLPIYEEGYNEIKVFKPEFLENEIIYKEEKYVLE